MKPLNPIMAVLVIASVGASPLRALAADGETTPAKAVATTEDKNPVNALTKLLSENPAARADAGKRAADFLLEDKGGKSFIGTGVNTTALGAVARDWGEKAGSVGSVAMFYFVAGPGTAAPAWAQKDPVLSKTFVPGMKWEDRLRLALADWTGKSQIDKTKEKSQATAFLNDAAAKAATVFSDPRTKAEIDLSVKANDTTATVVPGVNGPSRPQFDGSTSQYGMKELYLDGAVVVNVAGSGDANSRTISMKIYTKRMPDGTTRNEIGIFDITDAPDNIFGQRFPVGDDKSFVLDDRTPGHKKYELKFGKGDNGERTISFGRPGGGTDLKTSVDALYLKRANQAAALGNIVNVGGEEFYVLPQGGGKGALAMFSKSMIDNRDEKNARNIIPALYADVTRRDGDGRNENIPAGDKGGPHLGTVGGKDYHLVFNKDLKIWEVKEGAGDLPEAPKPPAATTGAGTGTGTGTGAGTGTGTTPDTSPAGGFSADDMISRVLTQTPGCKKEDSSKLAADLKGQYGLVACTEEAGGVHEILIVPKSVAESQQIEYPSMDGYQLLSGRLYDHYLVLVFDKMIQYLDLQKSEKTGYANAGVIDVPTKSATKFTDVNALVDAMVTHLGIAASDPAVRGVPANLTKQLGTKKYILQSSFPKGVFVVLAMNNGKQGEIWPNLGKPGEGPPAVENQYASVGGGAANAMDSAGTVSSAEQKFPAELLLPESRKAVPMAGHGATTDVAVYESVDAPKKYFLELKYYAKDPEEKKVFHQKFFEVFNDANPLPASFTAQGLLTAGAVVQKSTAASYRFIKGTGKTKGVLAMFQNKQVSEANQRDPKANCVGPVIWWGSGISRDAAQAACEKDEL
jgi:hypothetical protein